MSSRKKEAPATAGAINRGKPEKLPEPNPTKAELQAASFNRSVRRLWQWSRTEGGTKS